MYDHSIKKKFFVIPNLLRSLVAGQDLIYNAIWICIYNEGWRTTATDNPLCRFDQDEPEVCLLDERGKSVEVILDDAVETSHLSISFKETFPKLLHSYADVFSKTQKITNLIEHHMEVKSEKQFHMKLRPLSKEEKILCDLIKKDERSANPREGA